MKKRIFKMEQQQMLKLEAEKAKSPLHKKSFKAKQEEIEPDQLALIQEFNKINGDR